MYKIVPPKKLLEAGACLKDSEAPRKNPVYAKPDNWGRTTPFFGTTLDIKIYIGRYIRTFIFR